MASTTRARRINLDHHIPSLERTVAAAFAVQWKLVDRELRILGRGGQSPAAARGLVTLQFDAFLAKLDEITKAAQMMAGVRWVSKGVADASESARKGEAPIPSFVEVETPEPSSAFVVTMARLGRATAAAVVGAAVGAAVAPQQRFAPPTRPQGARDAAAGLLSASIAASRTSTEQFGRSSLRAWMSANDDVVTGWVWESACDQATCAGCWSMHGTTHTIDEELDDHMNGECEMVVTTEPLDSLDPETGQQLFDALDEDQQQAILGPSKWQMYSDGDIDWSDLATIQSTDYGDQVVPTTVGSLQEQATTE